MLHFKYESLPRLHLQFMRQRVLPTCCLNNSKNRMQHLLSLQANVINNSATVVCCLPYVVSLFVHNSAKDHVYRTTVMDSKDLYYR